MSKENGGPAFGGLKAEKVNSGYGGAYVSEYSAAGGMTLRDYFAAKAMHQFIAGAVFPKGYDRSNDLAMVAALAYETADAMIAERAK